jgi:hypothetical protein
MKRVSARFVPGSPTRTKRMTPLEQCLLEQRRGLRIYREEDPAVGKLLMNDWLEEELLIRKEANDPEA